MERSIRARVADWDQMLMMMMRVLRLDEERDKEKEKTRKLEEERRKEKGLNLGRNRLALSVCPTLFARYAASGTLCRHSHGRSIPLAFCAVHITSTPN